MFPSFCKPCLSHHKLSIWPPCGTVLTGGMHDDLSLIPAFKNECNLPNWIAADSHSIIESAPLLIAKVLFGINTSSVPLRCLWRKHGDYSSVFSHGILILTFWLAEAAEWLIKKNYWPERCSVTLTKWLSVNNSKPKFARGIMYNHGGLLPHTKPIAVEPLLHDLAKQN